MYKKNLFTTLLLTAILFTQMASYCLADAASRLEQANKYFLWYPEKAEEIYKAVVRDYSGTEDALEAYKRLVYVNLSLQKFSNAQNEVEKLKTDFAGHSGLADALWEIGQRCEYMARHDKTTGEAVEGNYNIANGIYRQIIRDYPSSSYVNKSQLAISRVGALFNIKSGQEASAQTAIASLKTAFSNNPALPRTLYEIARRYGKSKKYEQAKGLYQDIVSNYPDTANSKHALSSQKQLVFLAMSQNQYGPAQQALNKLITDFSGHKKLLTALYDIAWTYEQSGRYDQATSIYQQIIQKHPNINRSGQISPNDYRADKAGLDIGKCQILALIDAEEPNKPDTVLAAIDKLISDY
ncbi:MAG: tetratricopeptide repeat protein, partial [Planctomycetota bacterium]